MFFEESSYGDGSLGGGRCNVCCDFEIRDGIVRQDQIDINVRIVVLCKGAPYIYDMYYMSIESSSMTLAAHVSHDFPGCSPSEAVFDGHPLGLLLVQFAMQHLLMHVHDRCVSTQASTHTTNDLQQANVLRWIEPLHSPV